MTTVLGKRRSRWLSVCCLTLVVAAGVAALWRSRLTAEEWTLVGQWDALATQDHLELSPDRQLRWMRESSPHFVGRWRVVGERMIVEPPSRGDPPFHQRVLASFRRLVYAAQNSPPWPPLNLKISQVSADSFVMASTGSGNKVHWRRRSPTNAP